MFTHILAPLDGSSLAECVIPHVLSLAAAFDARVTVLHVMDRPRDTASLEPVDPFKWHFRKNEASAYLERIVARFKEVGFPVESIVQEGPPAERIINFASTAGVDLIVLSTHGSSGLSMWNVSSVVQKIILRANKSTLLVRAYEKTAVEFKAFPYKHLFVGLDCSTRAELVLPLAIRLAECYQARITLGTVLRRAELISRFPVPESDEEVLEKINQRNENAASHYLDQLNEQLTKTGVDIRTCMQMTHSPIAALHGMVDSEGADMVMLVAHGQSGEGRWPYGSVATSFIAYGTTSLFIMQDLSQGEISATRAEAAIRETPGH